MDVTPVITTTSNIDWSLIIITIIGSINTLGAAWFVYNQYTKNKKTDADIEKDRVKAELELEVLKERKNSDNQNIAIIYNELHELLVEIDADRVYIVQPHPPQGEHLISVSMEVSQKGVVPIRGSIQNLEFAEIPTMIKHLASNCWNFFSNIEAFDDSRAQSIARINGIHQMAAKKMLNSAGIWVGNLCIDYNTPSSINETKLKAFMKDHANTIQHILPKFKS